MVRRELQLLEMVDRIPERRADNNRPGGILFPDNRKGLTQILVPQLRSEFLVRLIEDLEHHGTWGSLAMLRNLPPKREEWCFVILRVLTHTVVFVKIQDYLQALGRGGVNRPNKRFPPRGTQPPTGGLVHVRQGMQVYPDGLEAGFFQQPEVLLLKTCLVARAPEGVIADDVHSPAKMPILFKDIHGLGLGKN